MDIILMAIGGYFVNGCWWLLIVIILVAMVNILLVDILLVDILFVDIGGY